MAADRTDPAVPTRAGLARLAAAAGLVRQMERSGYNLAAGGSLPAGGDGRPMWPVRVTGPASGGLPGLYAGVLLRLAYDPERTTAEGGPVGWYAPDAPPRPMWKLGLDGNPKNPPERDYTFYQPADADRPAEDLLPCLIAPQGKAALATGAEGLGLLAGEWDGTPIFVFAGGAAGGLVVQATAANNGSQWTTGLVQRFTSTGDLTAASPFEVVELKPLHESERLVSGQPYLCVDTGVRGSGGRRRLRAERLGGAGSPGGFREITVVTSVSCIGDAVHATIDRAYAPPATP